MITDRRQKIYKSDRHSQETLVSCLHAAISRQAGMYFMTSADREDFCSYERLLYNAATTARRLRSMGVKPGDEVMLQVDTFGSYLSGFWACLLGRYLAVPLACGSKDELLTRVHQVWRRLKNPWFISTTSQIRRIASFWETRHEDQRRLLARSLLVDLPDDEAISPQSAARSCFETSASPDDVAFIQFSSGSTGNPKGVVLTHAEILSNIKAFLERAHVTTDDIPLGWMPLTHDMGLIGTHLGSVVAGLTPVLMPTALFVRRPLLWLQKAHEHRATILSSPNFGLQYTLAALRDSDRDIGWNLGAVRLIWNGAEPVSRETCAEFETKFSRFGLRPRVIYPCYGLAEATVAVTLQDPGEPVFTHRLRRDSLGVGSEIEPAMADEEAVSFSECGYALPCCEVEIGDPSGNPVPVQHVGHVLIRGKSVTQGYYREAEATARAKRPGGWFDTGDLGFLTKSGRLVITGRTKDVIILNGSNLYPHDLERLIEKVEGVTVGQVAVCGVKSRNPALARTALAAFIVFRRNADQFPQVATAVRGELMDAAGIHIDYVVPVTRLPRTTSGKVRRFELAMAFDDHLLDALSEQNAIGHCVLEPRTVVAAGTGR